MHRGGIVKQIYGVMMNPPQLVTLAKFSLDDNNDLSVFGMTNENIYFLGSMFWLVNEKYLLANQIVELDETFKYYRPSKGLIKQDIYVIYT